MRVIAAATEASDDQRAAIEYGGGNAYVGAGPGTGKTYLLIERYRKLRAAGVAAERILLLTFSRRAVVDLRERLAAAGFAPSETEVRTFHGFAARVIGAGVPTFNDRRLLDGFSRDVVLEAAIAQTAMPAFGAGVRASRAFAREAARLMDDFGRAAPAALEGVRAAASPRLRDLLDLHLTMSAARARVGGSDIGDLITRAVDDVRRPGSDAARWLRGRYAHALVDEFQDTDRVQLELLAEIGAIIFAVGDEAQSIYRFRGASDDIVTLARERFGMRRFDLTISRRCPPDVCALASGAPIRDLATLRSAKSDDRPVDVIRLRALDDEVRFVADGIETEIEAGLPATAIAVLLRAYRPVGPLLVDELRRRGIAVTSTGREELLADSRVATLRAALDVLDRPADPERWMRLLTAGSLRFDAVAIRFAAPDVARLRLDDALPAALEALCVDGVLGGRELADVLRSAAAAWAAEDIGRAARRLARGLRLLHAVLDEEKPGDVRPAAHRLKLVCDALAAAQRTARTLSSRASCAEILGRFDDALPSLAIDDAGLDTATRGVRVLTVHAAKGLEFERVFIADAVQGRFPQEARPSTLLAADDRDALLRAGVDGPAIVPDGIEREEASLWYVALTRCASRLTITFADQGIAADVQRPSRFLDSRRIPNQPLRVDRESLVMRALRSPQAELRARLLVSGALDAAPASRDFARLGAAAFEPFAGMPLPAISLGVGDAERWLTCPRKLFYKKFARLPDEESPMLVVGTVLHAVLERFHSAHVHFDGSSADVGLWQAELQALRLAAWKPDAFASTVIAAAAARLVDAALAGYARSLAAYAAQRPFRVEEREIAIDVPVGRFRLVGKVDRVDRLPDGSRVIVDYKTGNAKKSSLAKQAEKTAAAWIAAAKNGASRPSLAQRLDKDYQLQLGLYAAAFEDVRAVAYVYLGGVQPTPERNGATFDSSPYAGAVREVVREALDELAAALLEPLDHGTLTTLATTYDETTCEFCAYARVCPGPLEEGA